jgi:hypothetical protein
MKKKGNILIRKIDFAAVIEHPPIGEYRYHERCERCIMFGA